MLRKRRTFVSLAVPVVVAAMLSACSPREAESLHTIPQGLQDTLESLRDPWGLYVEPAYFDQPGSVYSTALIDEALGREANSVRDRESAARQVCATPEKSQVTDPWFSWAVVRVLGRADLGCVSLAAPAITGDSSADIPRYYAWVDAGLATGARPESLVSAVRTVLRAPGRQQPYVSWRMDQLEDLLDLPSTAEGRPADPPRALRGPDDLTELWGYTMRCAARPALCVEGPVPSDREVAVAAVSYPDDLSLAGALAILRARDADDELAEIMAGVDVRRVPDSGLLRAGRFVGTIDATFAVLALDYALFPGPRPEITSAELLRRLPLIPTNDTVRRLKALAVLKAVDEQAWAQRSGEVEAAFAKYDGMTVTRKNLVEVAEAIYAFGVMGETPTVKLSVFPVDDQDSEQLARLAVSIFWAFDDPDGVLEAYAEVRRKAFRQARTPREPVAFYVLGLQSLNGAGLTLMPEDNAEIGNALEEGLQGCVINGVKAEKMYRFNVAATSSCSLDVTLGVARSGFGVLR